MARKNPSKQPEPQADKKPFDVPDFKLLGSVTELTKGPSGGAIDGLFGGIGGFTS